MTQPEPVGDLTADDISRIFTDEIAPDLLAGQASDDPVLVIVGGQPGAGKSRAQAAVVARLGLQHAVVIDADDMRLSHPRHRELSLADDLTAAAHTHGAASTWVGMAVDHVIAERYDVVYSATLSNPQRAAERIEQFRQAGYRVEIAVVGVHEALSRIGILARYQKGRDDDGYGRYVPGEVHREAYDGLLSTVDLVDREGLADAVTVFRRDGERVYTNTLFDGCWQQPAGTRQAIEQARARPWTEKEIADFRDTAADLAQPGRLPESLRVELAGAVSAGRDHLKAPAAAPAPTVDAIRVVAPALPQVASSTTHRWTVAGAAVMDAPAVVVEVPGPEVGRITALEAPVDVEVLAARASRTLAAARAIHDAINGHGHHSEPEVDVPRQHELEIGL